MRPADLPGISVVIPTYNRQETLARCLAALDRQDYPRDRMEVLAVDDGSTDATARWLDAQSFSFELRALHQANAGQGNARNNGVRRARHPIVLFLGDDIFLSPRGLAEHGAWHARFGREGRVAVLGRIDWARDLRVSSFMRHINEYGLQFGFSIIEDPMDVPFGFFYTSNISLSRDELLEVGLFDPSFRVYGWEDIELGYRLARRGLKILYNPEARAEHHHPTTFRSFTRRQRKVGLTAALFYRLHPELADFLQIGAHALPPEPRWKRALREAVCLAMERFRSTPFPRLYDRALQEHYLDGLREGLAKEGISPPQRVSAGAAAGP